MQNPQNSEADLLQSIGQTLAEPSSSEVTANQQSAAKGFADQSGEIMAFHFPNEFAEATTALNDSDVAGVQSDGNTPQPATDYSELRFDSELLKNLDFISFRLPSTAMGSRAINRIFINAKDRAVAEMVRDLQVVVSYHMRKMVETDLFPVEAITSSSFRVIEATRIPTQGLIEVVDKLKDLQVLFNCTLDHVEAPPVPLSQESGTSRVPLSSVNHSWPTNKSGAYLSKLVCRYSWCVSSIQPQELEITDYCLAEHERFLPEEPIFRCEGGPTVVRRDIMSINHDTDIQPIVVNAWSRICLDAWKKVGRYHRTCLSIVSKHEPVEEEDRVSDQNAAWISWISQSKIDIQKAEQICVPMFMDNQYNLLFVDFRTRLIQCVDTRYSIDRSGWDLFAEKTIDSFWALLDNLGDERVNHRNDFVFEVIHPHWSTTIHDRDSGLSTMHLIDLIGEAECDYSKMRLHEEHIRVQMRINMCAAIVKTSTNLHRSAVLRSVHEFIYMKNDASLQPSLEMINFRRMAI